MILYILSQIAVFFCVSSAVAAGILAAVRKDRDFILYGRAALLLAVAAAVGGYFSLT